MDATSRDKLPLSDRQIIERLIREGPLDVKCLQVQDGFARACAALNNVRSNEEDCELAHQVSLIVWRYRANKIFERHPSTRHPSFWISRLCMRLLAIDGHARELVELIGNEGNDLVFDHLVFGQHEWEGGIAKNAGEFPIHTELVKDLRRIASRAADVAQQLAADRKSYSSRVPSPEITLVRDSSELYTKFRGNGSRREFVNAVARLAGIEKRFSEEQIDNERKVLNRRSRETSREASPRRV
jgi:hypothetical protein